MKPSTWFVFVAVAGLVVATVSLCGIVGTVANLLDRPDQPQAATATARISVSARCTGLVNIGSCNVDARQEQEQRQQAGQPAQRDFSLFWVGAIVVCLVVLGVYWLCRPN